MQILIIDNGSSYISALEQLLGGHEVEIIPWNKIESSQVETVDFIILSGGHLHAVEDHEDLYAREIKLIQETQTPILGICLGFQLIAHTFGSVLKEMHAKEKGIVHLQLIAPDPIFLGIPSFEVYESHRWVVSEASEVLYTLATSKDGIEIIKHRDRFLYGFQFHPEMFVEKTDGDEIFGRVMEMVQASI